MLLLRDTWFGDDLRRLKWAIPGTFVLGWTFRTNGPTPPASLVRPLVVFVETARFLGYDKVNKYHNFNISLQHFFISPLRCIIGFYIA